MIVPRSRLLFWVAAVVLPFSVIGSVLPEMLVIALLFIATLLLLALVDAALALGALKDIALKLPELIRLSKDRPGIIELRIKNDGQKSRRVRLGLAFPCEIESPQEDLHVALPGGSEWSRVNWPCQPFKRGNYFLQHAYLERASFMGFWSVRSSSPVKSEIRVYPNLLTERKHIAALFLNRGSFGLHARRQVGKGRDFEKLREYIPGDSYDEIHWKATAKRGHPVTKVFQIERTQEVYVIIDASRLTGRVAAVGGSGCAVPSSRLADAGAINSKLGTPNSELVLERFITAALVLDLAAEQQGDLFGLLTVTDKV